MLDELLAAPSPEWQATPCPSLAVCDAGKGQSLGGVPGVTFGKVVSPGSALTNSSVTQGMSPAVVHEPSHHVQHDF